VVQVDPAVQEVQEVQAEPQVQVDPAVQEVQEAQAVLLGQAVLEEQVVREEPEAVEAEVVGLDLTQLLRMVVSIKDII
jgi:hypothetical protein